MRNAPSPIRANPTPFNPVEQYAREMPIVPPAPPASTAPLAPPAPGLITQIEHAVQEALEIGEAVAEGLSPWAIAGHLLALLAAGARALRARR